MKEIQKELEDIGNPKTAQILQRFFKTGQGEYGEGDVFRGVKVPQLRKLASKYTSLPLSDVQQLLTSSFHEDRLFALLILVNTYAQAESKVKNQIYQIYLENIEYINNWDLVDLSAPQIVGDFLSNQPKTILTHLAKSKNLWSRRIAIMATFHYIKHGEFDETLRITKLLLKDKEDLIHKAVGWMLREIGKRNHKVEENFLQIYYQQMPRTMLRYAIEKFPENKRQAYLKGQI